VPDEFIFCPDCGGFLGLGMEEGASDGRDTVMVIVMALAAGAVAAARDEVAQAARDRYVAFKALIVWKFGHEADVKWALERLEKSPDSETRQLGLRMTLSTPHKQDRQSYQSDCQVSAIHLLYLPCLLH
jgi:hypothetical protein